jgi:hypothetical protein
MNTTGYKKENVKNNQKSSHRPLLLLGFIRSNFANWGVRKLFKVDDQIKNGVTVSNFLICGEDAEVEFFSRLWETIKNDHPLRRMIQSRHISLIRADFPVYGFSLRGVTFFTSNQISEDGFENLMLQCAFKNYIDRHRERGIIGNRGEEKRIKKAFERYCRICDY